MKRKKPTYHIVSHSHWDREWYFPFDRFRAMLVDMVEELLVLFEKDKEFRSYTLDGQMAAVMDYLEIRPDRADKIRSLVRSRKLFIGPWYVLNDEFLSGGESHIRNLQFGFRLGSRLGGVMKLGYIPDQFSHIAQLPQILLGFELESAMFYRGFGGEQGQEPSEYWWRSPDGSQVLLHHMPKDGYSAGYFGTHDPDVIVQKFDRLRKELDARATTSQRLFFNGGDHHWPDAAVTNAVRVLRKHYDASVIHSNFPDFIAAVRKDLGRNPVLRLLEGETRFGFRHAYAVQGGVFSSRMYLKQMNAECQILLERLLEPLNVLAMTKRSRSKTPQIEQAWKYVIQNQDHDAICGTSTDEVHREMIVRYEKAKQIGAFVMQECFAALLPYDERAKEDDRFVFVFNPNPFARSEVVDADVDFYLQDIVVGLNPEVSVSPKRPLISGFRLLDDSGNEVPFSTIRRTEAFGITYSKHDYPSQTLVDRHSIVLAATDIPPLGWKGYSVVKNEAPMPVPFGVVTGKDHLENRFLRVEVRRNGEVFLKDKRSGRVYGPLNVFEDSGDVGDEYNYSYPQRDETFRSTQFKPTVTIKEQSPFRGTLAIRYSMRIPVSASPDERSRTSEKTAVPLVTAISLGHDSERIDITTTVHNSARDHRLRTAMFTGVQSVVSFADTPFAVVKREHREYDVSQFPYEHPALVAPMQRFVTLSDGEKGMTLIAKGLPEYELSVREKGKLSLTLLRCVGKLSGRDLITRPGGAAGWWTETPEAQCPGEHTFEYALLPHSGNVESSWPLILREADRFLAPAVTVNRKNDQKVLEYSFLSIDPAVAQVTAVKEAENGNGIIVRICNPVGQSRRATLRFHRPVLKAHRCLLNEKNIEPLKVRGKNAIPLFLKPFEIFTLRIRLAPHNPKSKG
ncbi:MAG: glycoside hydrolase family 38 C-terminal domain-containing protein [Bacteroidota bacterium]